MSGKGSATALVLVALAVAAALPQVPAGVFEVSGVAIGLAPSSDGAKQQPGRTAMADEAAVLEAEAAVKAAEAQLNEYLGGTVTRGIVLNEERGRNLRELRAAVDAAKKRLDEAKGQ